MTDNIKSILVMYSQFANLTFQWKGDFDSIGSDTTANPEDVGRAGVTDINISWFYSTSARFSGISGSYRDSILGYTGSAGDIFLNGATPNYYNDYTLSSNTQARQTLIHELGHSLGLSHPHSNYTNGVPTITSDYAATKYIGFDKLGFNIYSAADMYKEYFSIMSYDDQLSILPGSNVVYKAYTPMILDVIALQQAYGEGVGTSGAGNDTILAGTVGYRTYFDTGGIDTIDLSSYSDSAYLNMGVTITGASHLVGVAMSIYDALNTVLQGGDPAHLRWFYGEYENAIGSANTDMIMGNDLNNVINGMGGDDRIMWSGGYDTIDGGTGIDMVTYKYSPTLHTIEKTSSGYVVSGGIYGRDTLTGVERLEFSNINVALDFNDNAGKTAKILGAAFGAISVSNKEYVGIGLNLLDRGMSYEALAALAIDASGAKTQQQVVSLLWTNVVGSAPSTDQARPFIDMLAAGMTIGQLGVLAAETDLNQMNINLVGLTQTGLEYIMI